MDGGGRYLQPITAPRAGSAARTPIPEFRGQKFRFGLFDLFRPARGVRRRADKKPIERRVPRFLGTALALGFLGTVTVTGLWQGGHLDDFIQQYGEPHHALGRLFGFGLEQITISGLAQMRESDVLAAAGLNAKLSLIFLDVNDVRDRLEHVPMIKSATVRKLYPHELVIGLVERQPYAIWQRNGELFVIGSDGTVLNSMHDARYVNLPFVVGEKANSRSKDYVTLLDAAGPLRSRIRAGTLISGRRWNLKIDNGMDVSLPELGAADAMARLVKLERDQKILEKDVLAIDLRIADRVVVRLSEEAASARAEAMKKKPMRGKGVDT